MNPSPARHREARRPRPRRRDVQRHAAGRAVVHGRHRGPEVSTLEGDELIAPQRADQFDRLLEPAEALVELGPLETARGDLVHRLAGADAEANAPRLQHPERAERLGDNRRVMAERRRQHGGAEPDATRALPERGEPRRRVHGVPVGVPPRLDLVADPDCVEPGLLGQHTELEQRARIELLTRRLVAQAQHARPFTLATRRPAGGPVGGPATVLDDCYGPRR